MKVTSSMFKNNLSIKEILDKEEKKKIAISKIRQKIKIKNRGERMDESTVKLYEDK